MRANNVGDASRRAELASTRRGGAIMAALALVLLAAGASGRPTSGRTGQSERIHELFAEYTRPGSPGVAVLVVRDGQVLHEAGYGLANIESGEPITESTAFRLASVSKQFAGMATMILAERGKLGYDDPVLNHLPELARYGSRITVRNLLNHTSGLPDYYDALAEVSGESMPTNEDALGFLADWGEPLFAAGERYEYSNPGYEMLAVIVERAASKAFGQFLEEDLFARLGMTDSIVFDSREPEMRHRAYGYSRSDDGGFVLNDAHPLNHLTGSGGIYSTVRDLLRWDQALYDEQLVRRSTLEEGWQPTTLSDGSESPYGFGWRLGSYGALGRRIAHAGGWLGFSTYILRYPDARFSVILLSNFEDFDGEAVADRITDIVFPSRLIQGATVVDGTGSSGTRTSVRVEGGVVTEVGAVEPKSGDLVVDGSGLVLAPGFIDSHSHADSEILDMPAALAAVSQGITTVVVGQDGGSEHPLGEFFTALEQKPPAVNVASYSGHGTLREEVMGEDFRRPATESEVSRMADLLRDDMSAGALGLSTGLEYDPGIYSSAEEVIALSRVAAAHGGRYISHIRSEDRRFHAAIEEILGIAEKADIPVQISHIKLALQSLHGTGGLLLERLDQARAGGVAVTADIYPYTYWQSTLTVMFPDRDYEDPQAAAFAVEELSTPEGMLIPVFEPDPKLAGKTLAEISEIREMDPATTLIELIREAEAMKASQPPDGDERIESIIAVSMKEDDIERLMRWPQTVFCTDGSLAGAHPRGFGSFPRILGRYVRERQVLSLEDAIHRMTALTAAHLGIGGRGTIAPGMAADLVLFNPVTILDRATTDEPHAVSVGVEKVWVQGQLVLDQGRSTNRRPGSVLRRRSMATKAAGESAVEH